MTCNMFLIFVSIRIICILLSIIFRNQNTFKIRRNHEWLFCFSTKIVERKIFTLFRHLSSFFTINFQAIFNLTFQFFCWSKSLHTITAKMFSFMILEWSYMNALKSLIRNSVFSLFHLSIINQLFLSSQGFSIHRFDNVN